MENIQIIDTDIANDPTIIVQSQNFALATYSTILSTNQHRVIAAAMAQISPKDNMNTLYKIDVREMADEIKVNRAGLARGIDIACKELVENSPILMFTNEDGKLTRAALVTAITTIDRYTYELQFGSLLHPYLVEMKEREQDIFYNLSQKIHMRRQYTPILYDMLLGYLCNTLPDSNGIFTIQISPDEIMNRFHYDTNELKTCNQRAIYPACKEINDLTSIDIIDGKPILVKEKKKAVGYIFKIKYKENADIPVRYIAEKSKIKFYNSKEIPSMSELLSYLEKIGVNKQFLRFIENENNPIKCYKTILYIIKVGQQNPKYFNAAYKAYWAANIELTELMNATKEKKNPLLVQTQLSLSPVEPVTADQNLIDPDNNKFLKELKQYKSEKGLPDISIPIIK